MSIIRSRPQARDFGAASSSAFAAARAAASRAIASAGLTFAAGFFGPALSNTSSTISVTSSTAWLSSRND